MIGVLLVEMALALTSTKLSLLCHGLCAGRRAVELANPSRAN